MKDIPVFTTENGAASLILKEIPYRKTAYIKIQDTLAPEQLLQECTAFCTMCGAEYIYASGHDSLSKYPLHTAIIEMAGSLPPDTMTQDNMWPVTEATVSEWRRIYNEKMCRIDNAGTLESKDEADILQSGGAYFVHSAGTLLGIGWLEEDRIEAVASVYPGGGARILTALLSMYPGDVFRLEVASTNQKAISLYERMGFLGVCEKSRWYKIK